MDNNVEFQIKELVPLFISEDEANFDEIVREANELVEELEQCKMRKTNSLLLAVLRTVLAKHGYKFSVPEISEKTGEAPNTIYMRESQIRDKGFNILGKSRKKKPGKKSEIWKKIGEIRPPKPVTIKQESPKAIDALPTGGIEAYLEEKMVSVIDRFLGKKIAEIDRKLDLLVTVPASIPDPEPLPVSREMHLAIIDLNHVINYFVSRKMPVDLESCIDALERSIKQEHENGFKLSSYMYLSRHYNDMKEDAFYLIDCMVKNLGISEPDLHAYVTEEKKGFLPSGATKFQDVDVYIVDKMCELFLTHGKEIKTMHMISGDIDMMPVVRRAISAGVKVKLISFEDAISRRLAEEAGLGSIVAII